ncbi:MAG: leucine--tRNA ligase [Phycisphaeraceae bacterium]
MKYDPSTIERQWQTYWAEQGTFKAMGPEHPGFDADRPKYYVLAMFPYPSGAGMHIGHALNYTSTDIIARYKRMQGHNVLHPIGFDAFGLPAEQYAVEHNVHPAVTTQQNIDNITEQLKSLGLSFDWDRSFATTEPDYYKWTQWIFLQLYNAWFDQAAGKARPISELRQLLMSGEYEIGPDGELIPVGASGGLAPISGSTVGSRRWQELTTEQQNTLIDEYRLAYLDEVAVNWCPQLGTVLANEEVTAEGRSERGNFPVYKRPLKQWMLRITAYADRLIEDLDRVDWPEAIKQMQRNWIGRSEGAEVAFPIADEDQDETINVFTTRPDTLFGATYMVLAPEHPLVESITTSEQYHQVNEYRNQAEARSDIDRQAETREKTGVFTGAHAINPVSGEKIPVWIADYVLMGYGTGAIMAVPAHDQRDFEFAQQFGLPIRPVVMPGDHWLKEQAEKSDKLPKTVRELRHLYLDEIEAFPEAFTGNGMNVNSASDDLSLNDLETPSAKRRIIDWMAKQGVGHGTVQYKLRDWLFSRQRYWGEPFPIVHCPDGGTQALGKDDLPVELPEMEDFRPTATEDPDAPPQPPLGRAPESWKYVELGGERCERELNTMPQWAGSCWYYLRFLDPDNDERFVSREAERYWMGASKRAGKRRAGREKAGRSRDGVDMYIGGVEHAVLHLLYARFWHKVLYDLGHVSTPEPFGRLFNQGYVQAYAYTDARGVYVPAEEVEEKEGKFYHRGEEVQQEFGKMGKSLKNSVVPDEVIDEYGADSLRLYLMYLGPLEQSKVWRGRDIVGVHRFLARLWRNLVDEETGEVLVLDQLPPEELARKMHQTIKRASNAMEALSFNVAIAALIELNNELVGLERVPREVAEVMVRLLAPLAPHVSEELWQKLGQEGSVADADWPSYDEKMLVAEQIELPVQVNGKVRSRISVPADADQVEVERIAREDEKVQSAVGDQAIRKVIVIPGRMVNVVAK